MKMRKLLAILMALALVMSFSVGALAAIGDGDKTITVSNVNANTELDIYQILTYDINTGGGNYSNVVFVNAGFASVFLDAITTYDSGAHAMTESSPTGLQILLHITNTTALQADDFAKWLGNKLKAYVENTANNISEYATEVDGAYDNGELTFTKVKTGYYLILDQTDYAGYDGVAVGVMLKPTDPGIEVTLKSEAFPPIVKTASTANVSVGDPINYTITVAVPQFNTVDGTLAGYQIVDTLGVGAAAPAESAYVVELDGTSLGYNTDYTAVQETVNGETITTFTFSLTESQYAAAIGKNIVITYTALVNSNATENGIVNKVTENGYFGYPRYEDVTTFTYGFKVNKYDRDDTSVKLEGVEFYVFTWVDDDSDGMIDDDEKTYLTFSEYTQTGALYDYYYDANTTNQSIFTDADGLIKAWGLAAGIYYLEEITPKDGYNNLAAPEEFEIEKLQDEATVVSLYDLPIPNVAGILIPGTGGIGTTLFTIFGGVIILGAFVLLIANRKRIFGK